jgi:hypothetical protein
MFFAPKTGPTEAGEKLVAPLRGVGKPLAGDFAVTPYLQLQQSTR